MARYNYILRRLLQAIPVLIGLSMLIFVLTRVIPGDPVRLALGPSVPEEQVMQLREEMGLNDPIYIQYADWFIGVLQRDWGLSLRTDGDVYTDIMAKIPATLELVMVALFFAVIIAIPLGVIAGTNKDKVPDHVARIIALFGVSMPSFWVAILLQVIFAGFLGLFPLTGRLSRGVEAPPELTNLYMVDSLLYGQFDVFLDAAHHLVLPALALSFGTLATVSRLIRSDMIEEGRKDYTTAARAYGLPENLISYKYMLKNAFTSSLTILGLAFAFLLGNAFLVEIVFGWPGMARYGVQAITFLDFNAIIGVVMIVGVAFVLVNLIVDLLYGWLDPRVAMQESQ